MASNGGGSVCGQIDPNTSTEQAPYEHGRAVSGIWSELFPAPEIATEKTATSKQLWQDPPDNAESRASEQPAKPGFFQRGAKKPRPKLSYSQLTGYDGQRFDPLQGTNFNTASALSESAGPTGTELEDPQGNTDTERQTATESRNKLSSRCSIL
ncbi:hypothetical protein BD324DRAFT_628979 [Kockovaella imperatae]|uniref:Uncharacterized protein n=1 Tax=Kockovaella imperatae TaxID=4999 RepID=A0A1Y1UEQ6_9TREE|nr:hypothetical protein BD324DRAFT_628979 [Kockovaella imperatae]ORX36469.1 hypothetical protein BD324DRAFT_628979 [Kockovaella imperatae]